MSDVFLRKQPSGQQNLSTIDQPKPVQPEEGQPVTEEQQQSYNDQLARFEQGNVKLKDGSYVSKDIFNKLSPDEQEVLRNQGIDAYQKYYVQKQETELSRNNVKLNTGEWIDKTTYNNMPDEWQQRLQSGTNSWKSFWNSRPYGGATSFVIGDYNGTKVVYGVTSDPLIGIDASGMRVYLGDTWPDVAKTYSGKPGAINTAEIVARGEQLIASKFDIETPKAISIATKQETPQSATETEQASIIGYSPTTKEILVKGEKTGIQQWQSEKGTDFEKLSDSQKDEIINSGYYTDVSADYGMDYGSGGYNAGLPESSNEGLGAMLVNNKDIPKEIRDIVSSDKNLYGILNTLFPDKNNTTAPLKALQGITDKQVTQITDDPLSLIPFTWVSNISKMDTPEIIANSAIDVVFTALLLRGVKIDKTAIKTGLKEIGSVLANEKGYIRISPQTQRDAVSTIQQATKIVQTIDPRKSGIPDRMAADFIKQRIYNPTLTPEQFMKTRSVFDVLNRPAPITGKPVINIRQSRPTPQIKSSIDAAIARQKKEALQSVILQRAQNIAKAKAQSKALSEAQRIATSENAMAAAVSPIIEKSLADGVITRTINANPESFIRAYQAATPQVQQSVRANLDPTTLKALLSKSATQLKTATLTQVKVLEALQTITSNAALVATKTQLQGKTLTQTKTQTEAYTKAQTEALPDTEVKTQVKPLVETMVKTVTETKVQTQTKPQTKVEVKVKLDTKTDTKTKLKETVKPKPKEPVKEKPNKGKRPPIIIKLKDGTEVELTEKMIKGSLAWKQGFIYKLWSPPFNDNSMFNTTDPVEGVKYYEGIGSAVKSLVALGGEIPQTLHYDMGIQDITIERTRDIRKPKMKFKLDRKQQTTRTGIITKRK